MLPAQKYQKMANWREEYLTSLKGSEMNHPVNMELVQTCMGYPRNARNENQITNVTGN